MVGEPTVVAELEVGATPLPEVLPAVVPLVVFVALPEVEGATVVLELLLDFLLLQPASGRKAPVVSARARIERERSCM
tara:strand:- start:955 stop:1188 length:234 start_codon:yes stop_codon:yes gene_type:complete